VRRRAAPFAMVHRLDCKSRSKLALCKMAS
jgi:hypothetical protein